MAVNILQIFANRNRKAPPVAERDSTSPNERGSVLRAELTPPALQIRVSFPVLP
jgi:hypothetical protein